MYSLQRDFKHAASVKNDRLKILKNLLYFWFAVSRRMKIREFEVGSGREVDGWNDADLSDTCTVDALGKTQAVNSDGRSFTLLIY